MGGWRFGGCCLFKMVACVVAVRMRLCCLTTGGELYAMGGWRFWTSLFDSENSMHPLKSDIDYITREEKGEVHVMRGWRFDSHSLMRI